MYIYVNYRVKMIICGHIIEKITTQSQILFDKIFWGVAIQSLKSPTLKLLSSVNNTFQQYFWIGGQNSLDIGAV